MIGFMFGQSVKPFEYDNNTHDLKLIVGLINIVVTVAVIIIFIVVHYTIGYIEQKRINMENTLRGVNHETRGPLNNIYLDCRICSTKISRVLNYKEEMDKYNDYNPSVAADLMKRSINRLDKIEQAAKAVEYALGDMKDLKLIENGHVNVEITEFPVGAVLDNLNLSLVHKREEYRHLTFKDIKENYEIKIKADLNKTIRIVYNFIMNALRHTKEGCITTGIRTSKDYIIIFVRDTGEGINHQVQKKLFKHSIDSNNGGMGIGLMVCAKYAEAMGGRIECNSKLGKGTEMRLVLPKSSNLEKQIVNTKKTEQEEVIVLDNG